MSQQELDDLKKELQESKDRETVRDQELARLRTESIGREAHALVVESLAESALPGKVRVRLTSQLSANPPLKEGALDKDALTAAITEAIKVATEEVAEVAESMGGTPIRGFGGGGSDTDPKAELAALFEANGHSKEVAARMAAR